MSSSRLTSFAAEHVVHAGERGVGSDVSARVYVPSVMDAICWSVASSSWVWTWKSPTRSVVPAGLPRPTVWMRTPWSDAACAASMGSGRTVFSPSESSTMTAESSLPGGTGTGVAVGSGDRLV